MRRGVAALVLDTLAFGGATGTAVIPGEFAVAAFHHWVAFAQVDLVLVQVRVPDAVRRSVHLLAEQVAGLLENGSTLGAVRATATEARERSVRHDMCVADGRELVEASIEHLASDLALLLEQIDRLLHGRGQVGLTRVQPVLTHHDTAFESVSSGLDLFAEFLLAPGVLTTPVSFTNRAAEPVDLTLLIRVQLEEERLNVTDSSQDSRTQRGSDSSNRSEHLAPDRNPIECLTEFPERALLGCIPHLELGVVLEFVCDCLFEGSHGRTFTVCP